MCLYNPKCTRLLILSSNIIKSDEIKQKCLISLKYLVNYNMDLGKFLVVSHTILFLILYFYDAILSVKVVMNIIMILIMMCGWEIAGKVWIRLNESIMDFVLVLIKEIVRTPNLGEYICVWEWCRSTKRSKNIFK